MIFENIALAIGSLKSNKMRSILTMLGIIIGITAVIAIVTIGNAMTASVSSNLSSFGTSNINLFVQEKSLTARMGGNMMMMGGGPMPGGGGMTMTFRMGGRARQMPEDSDLVSDAMVKEFMETFPDEIAGVSATYSAGSATARDGDLYANISITGTNTAYILANPMTILSGRYLSEKDLENNRFVAVVSDKFVNNMFSAGTDPLGKQVKAYKDNVIEIYTIIGVYKYEQSGFGMDSTASEQDLTTSFYIPITTAKQDVLEKNYSQLTVVAAKDVDVINLTTQITDYFADIYKKNTTWGISATSMESQLNTITETLGSIALAIAFIAAISLLVGGIGVMNIMLVSVTERTREIGTRKALGAKNFHIRLQFVTEAAIISVIGGIIGVILGTAVGIWASIVMGAPITLSVLVISGSVLFSMLIGIFFGYYPANKAAKLDPIDALRYE